MTIKKNFKVISKGNFVAGQRSPGHGGTIVLTAAQAEYPLLMGEIEAADKPVPAAAPVNGSEKQTPSGIAKDKG